MANINVTFTENTITVDETTSNVTVTETVSNIIVSGSSIASNADIRAAISATSPITYNSTTGVIGADANALFTGKTTDDLPEGNTNLYFEDSRAVVAVYNGNVQVKRFAETRVDNGNVSGAVTFNVAQGTIHSAKLVGNVSGITLANIYAGGSATLILQQDEVGGHTLSTNTMTSWKFVNTNNTLDSTANAYNILSVVYDGTTYLASMVDFGTAVSGTITINGVSIPLGGSGNLTTTNIPEGANLYYTNARVLAYVTDSGLDFNAEKVDDRVANLLQTSGNLTFTYNDAANTLTLSQSLTTTDITEGANLYYTTGRANTAIAAYTAANPITVGGNLTVNGNINATGNINYQNVTDLYVTDQKITLNSNAATNANVEVIAFRPTATDTKLRWNEQATRWQFTNDGSTYYNLPTSTSDVAEGTNLYYTNARVTSLLSSGNVTSNVQTGGVLKVWNSSIPANSWIETRYILAYDNTLKITGAQNGGSANINLDVIGNINLSDATTGGAAKYSNFKNGQLNHTYYSNDSIFYGGLPGIRVRDNLYNNNVYEYTGAQSGSWFAVRGNLIVDSNTSTITGVTGDGVQINANGTVVASGNITGSYLLGNGSAITGLTTTQVSEGTNLYFTPERVRGNISAAENITYNSTTGVIGMANALANVNSITSTTSTNFTINTSNSLVIRETVKGVTTNAGNINGNGYGIFIGTGGVGKILDHSGTSELTSFAFATGNTTSGSNTITNVTLVDIVDLVTPLSLSNVTQYYAWDYNFGLGLSFPFPPGTYVQSVNAGAGTITMSQAAAATTDLNLSILEPQGITAGLAPGAFDANTGLLLGLISVYSGSGSGSKTAIAGQVTCNQGKYGYPATGPVPADFVYSVDTPSDYSATGLIDTDKLIARTQFEAPRTVMNFPSGLTVGDADLTNRAENDSLPSFGVNILWDGLSPTTQYADGTPLTQLLIKNYTDNNLQATNRTSFGPRLFFTASEGNKNQSYVSTYPRKNLELGRISWWSPSQQEPNLGTAGPPAWISAVTGQDNLTTNSGAGMFFGISPNTANFNRSLFLASSMGNTVIASAQDSTGAHRPIIFAPSHVGSSQGNSALLYNQTIDGTDTITDTVQTSGAHFAQINYNNVSALTGAKVSVTNGNNTNSTREGNIVLSIDRNLTSANTIVRSRTGTGAQGTNYYGSSNPDRVRFTFAPQGLVDGTAVTIRNFTNATVAGALNGNVFYVKRNDSGGYIGYELYTDSGLTTGVNLGVTNVNAGPGTFEYARNNGVTAKEWTWVLPQGSNDLILAEDGVTRTTFASGGNVSMNGNLTITGRHTYDRVYGEFFSNVAQTANAANTPTAITLNNTGISSDISIVNNSNITIAKPGNYNLQFSLQLANSDNSNEHDLDVWLRKNGTNVPNSNTQYTVVRGRSGANGKNVAALNLFLDAAAGDVYELVFAVTNTAVTIEAIAELTTPYARPATPSAIVTVAPIGA